MRASGIGGQAVMEGVMVKNKNKYAVAVRKPDNEVVIDIQEYRSAGEKHRVLRLPVIRGVVAFVESMVIGVRTLTYSASFFEEDTDKAAKSETKAGKRGAKTDKRETKADKRRESIMMAGTVCFSILLAVGIFMMLPYFLSTLLSAFIESALLMAVLEGVIRLVLFVGYVSVISLMKDIRRVYMYHGAEHKSINCIENGCVLTVANVKKHSRLHKRCGTSFMLLVILLSIIFFVFIRVDAAWLRVVLRLVLIPVIAGISYEFIKLAGRSESKLVGIISKPGLMLQRLTTREPDDAMIEVAIKSVEAVFDWKDFLAGGDGAIKNADKPETENAEPAKADDVTGDKPEAKVKAEIKSKPEAESKAEAEKKAEAGKKAATGKPEAKSKTETEKKAEAESKAETGKKSGVRSKTAADSKPAVKDIQDEAFLEEAAATAEESGTVSTARNNTKRGSFKNPNEWPTGNLADEDDDEDDDILKALDQYFVLKQKKDN